MSLNALAWAFDQPLKAREKTVLLALANCHNAATGQCNPSIDYLARMAGVNRRTVIRAVTVLVEAGLIKVRKHVVRGRKLANQYQLLLDGSASQTGQRCPTDTTNNDSQSRPIEPGTLETGKETAPPNGDGAAAPKSRDESLRNSIFDRGINLLVAAGKSQATASAIIGRFRKLVTDQVLAEILEEAATRSAPLSDPVAWIMAAINRRNTVRDHAISSNLHLFQKIELWRSIVRINGVGQEVLAQYEAEALKRKLRFDDSMRGTTELSSFPDELKNQVEAFQRAKLRRAVTDIRLLGNKLRAAGIDPDSIGDPIKRASQ